MRLFYILNGCDLQAPGDAAYDFVISIATGAMQSVPDVADQLVHRVVPPPRTED